MDVHQWQPQLARRIDDPVIVDGMQRMRDRAAPAQHRFAGQAGRDAGLGHLLDMAFDHFGEAHPGSRTNGMVRDNAVGPEFSRQEQLAEIHVDPGEDAAHVAVDVDLGISGRLRATGELVGQPHDLAQAHSGIIAIRASHRPVSRKRLYNPLS
ncbi:MAG: hypothetical protein E6I88_07855 [Chloroflexi bacterium]|nr:MAG: hypothetical protein E6I88_07855 [Chloroflexota bacterium]